MVGVEQTQPIREVLEELAEKCIAQNAVLRKKIPSNNSEGHYCGMEMPVLRKVCPYQNEYDLYQRSRRNKQGVHFIENCFKCTYKPQGEIDGI